MAKLIERRIASTKKYDTSTLIAASPKTNVIGIIIGHQFWMTSKRNKKLNVATIEYPLLN